MSSSGLTSNVDNRVTEKQNSSAQGWNFAVLRMREKLTKTQDEGSMCHSGDKAPHLPVQTEVLEREKPRFPGLSVKRMMGLEPTTFCMASRTRSLWEGVLLLFFR